MLWGCRGDNTYVLNIAMFNDMPYGIVRLTVVHWNIYYIITLCVLFCFSNTKKQKKKYNKATVTKMPVEGEIAVWNITNAK